MGRPVDQCLQQFINQSPWDWGPVRQRLAQRLVETIRPKAWVLEEVVFPKNGSDSVGVARQFVNSAGRLINCQVGLAVVLVGEDGGCPVNWRLLLPRSWDEDDTRRGRTRLPAHERSRPRWQHLLELIDEMMIDWGLPPAPVVIDARAIQGVEPLIRGLADRGLPYMVRVAQNRLSSIAPRLPARPMPDPVRTRLHAVQGGGHPQPYEVGRHRHHGVERQATRQGPRPIWLTDLGRSRQPDLAGLVSLRKKAVTELSTAEEESGLQHFEGRSFQGWHHHVTLVSVAHAYRMLRRLDGENVEERCLRPHG